MNTGINTIYRELHEYLSKNESDIVLIDGNEFSLSQLKSLNFDQLSGLLRARPGKKLYKYCSFRGHAMENIQRGQVYLRDPSEFDDVFDSKTDCDINAFINYRLKCYLSVINSPFAPKSSNADLFKLLFHELGKRGETYGEFQEYLSSISADEILKLRLQVVYLNALRSSTSPEYSIEKAIYDEFKEFIQSPSEYRVSCFSTNQSNIKMWSLYADNSKGLCIEYTVPEHTDLLVFSVLYSHIRGDANWCIAFHDTFQNEEIWLKTMMESILRKDVCWLEQNEYRLIMPASMCPDNLVPFFPITNIFLGNRVEEPNVSAVKAYCEANNIGCYQMKRNVARFELFPVIL